LGEDRPRDDAEPAQAPNESAEVSVVADTDPAPESEAAQAYHQRARLAEDRLAEVLGAYRKLKTDNEGHRERITRNLDRRYEQRRERLLLKFIDILDNLDRALEAAQISYAGEPLLEGMVLVRTQLLQTLQDEGLERIPVVGRPFDPHLSESVGTEPVSDPDQDHIVVKEHARGYRLNGKIARASTVVIGVYTPSHEAKSEKPADAHVPAVVGLDVQPPNDLEGIEVGTDAEPAEAPARDDVEIVEAVEPPSVPAIIDDAPPAIIDDAPGIIDEAAATEAPPAEPEASLGEPSLEEIIARAEAQEALFPQVFNPPPTKKPKTDS
jgi:molecular chaperone GrpE